MLLRSFRRSALVFVAALLAHLAVQLLHAQVPADEAHTRTRPADASELAAITARGRAVAAYDKAAWYASDAVQALQPENGLVETYIAQQTDKGWVVAFGKLNAARDAFLVAFVANPTDDPVHPKVLINTPPAEERGAWLYEARAAEIVRSYFQTTTGPYNIAVIPAPDREWYVYAYPAQTKDDIFPTGADIRYRISADGRTVLQTHRMHGTLLENKVPPPGTKSEFLFHTAVVDDAPEDTDVADVLMLGGLPMIVACPNFTYQIQADGKAVSLGKTKDFLKNVQR